MEIDDNMCANESDTLLSIVVVTWNGKKYALECLESLRLVSPKLSAEIIVVDNDSNDGTPEAIRQEFPNVTLIENEANLGFAKANNIGVALSRGKYVCLINSDVVIPSGCLEKMVEFMESHPEIGVLGPKMRSPDGGIGASVMRLPTVWNTLCCALGLHSVFPRSGLFGGFMMNGYAYDAVDKVEVLTGWFWMIPRKALQMVGLLDEDFFMYGEDIDWCHRFREAGWQVVFYSDAEALHYGAASSGNAPTRFYVEMRRANLQYFHKHHGRLAVLGYLFAIWIHELTRMVGYSVLYCLKGNRRSDAAFKIQRSAACMSWLMGNESLLKTPAKLAKLRRTAI
jgi:GT2 family glycosyltransferase